MTGADALFHVVHNTWRDNLTMIAIIGPVNSKPKMFKDNRWICTEAGDQRRLSRTLLGVFFPLVLPLPRDCMQRLTIKSASINCVTSVVHLLSVPSHVTPI
jgi:hypothetical protein